MTNATGPFRWVSQKAKLVLILALCLLGLGVIVTGYSILDVTSEKVPFIFYLPFILILIALLIVASILFIAYGLVKVAIRNSELQEQMSSNLATIETTLRNQYESIRKIEALGKLSDQTKSLIYHEREAEALRETIHAMLLKQNYSAASSLIKRMEETFGLPEESAKLRLELEKTKQKTVEEKIDAAISRIQAILNRQDWSQAKREAKRLTAIFPMSPKVKALPTRIQEAWNSYKGLLLKNYGEAVAINDVERSIELLKELDKYLTPQEGSALAESARDVFKKKLHNLGVQFAIHVTDQEWNQAVSTGENIIAEFPNSRMAREVRAKLDLLKDYAAGRKKPLTAQELMQMSDDQLDELLGNNQISKEHIEQVRQLRKQQADLNGNNLPAE